MTNLRSRLKYGQAISVKEVLADRDKDEKSARYQGSQHRRDRRSRALVDLGRNRVARNDTAYRVRNCQRQRSTKPGSIFAAISSPRLSSVRIIHWVVNPTPKPPAFTASFNPRGQPAVPNNHTRTTASKFRAGHIINGPCHEMSIAAAQRNGSKSGER